MTGASVRLPRFNFMTKSREESAVPVVLAPDQVILIEGIHALNPELTAEIPEGAAVYYLNLFTDEDLVVSSEHEEL